MKVVFRSTDEPRVEVDMTISSFSGIKPHQIFMKRARNVCVMALASSTKPSSSRSCTLPRMPDSKAEETRNSQHVFLFQIRLGLSEKNTPRVCIT